MMNNSQQRHDVDGAAEGPLASLPFQTLQTAAGLLPIPSPAVPHNSSHSAPPMYAGGNAPAAAAAAARQPAQSGKGRTGGRKLCEVPSCNTTANYGHQGQSECSRVNI
jgi:hypothetical protein